MDKRMNEWMDGRTDGRMDGQTDGCLEIHPCPTGHQPFGAAVQKGLFSYFLTHADRPTDQRTKPLIECATCSLDIANGHFL